MRCTNGSHGMASFSPRSADREDGNRLKSEFGAELAPIIMDITDRATIIAAAEQVSSGLKCARLGRVGQRSWDRHDAADQYATPEDLQEIFEINVFGQLAVTRAFLPLIRKSRGRIVNISSVGAHIADPFGGPINASKSAFGTFSDTLRLELHPFGIHVCTVEPGAIKTPAVGRRWQCCGGSPHVAAARWRAVW